MEEDSVKPTLSHNYRLENLRKWLNFELTGGILFFLSFFYVFAFYLLGFAMLIFIPYLLFILYREDRYGWIAALFILVVLPAVIGNIVISQTMLGFVLNYSIIGIFFLYCFALKLTIPQWMD